MKVERFTLLELLQSRTWLVLALNSTRMFTTISKEQMTKARARLAEIEQELVIRLIEGKDPETKVFQDMNFEQTLENLSKRDGI
jgi:hypothetical protein